MLSLGKTKKGKGKMKTINYKTKNDMQEKINNALDRNQQTGKALATYSNLMYVLDNDPNYSGVIRYNTLTMTIEIQHEGGYWAPITDNDLIDFLVAWEKLYTGNKATKDTAFSAFSLVARKNPVNPIRDYVLTLPDWDGKERLQDFVTNAMGAEKTWYNVQALQTYMFGMIARALRPGVKFDYILTLQGPQGCDKSTLLSRLVQGVAGGYATLGSIGRKGDIMHLQGRWIVELDKLIALKGNLAVKRLEEFASRQTDTFRAPYDRREKSYDRVACLAATTNEVEFLTNRTGNRRWLVICCGTQDDNAIKDFLFAKDADYTKNYITQLWAEVFTYFKTVNSNWEKEMYYKNYNDIRWKGLVLSPMAEKERQRIIEGVKISDPMEDNIINYINNTDGDYLICGKQVWEKMLHRSGQDYDQKAAREINTILQKHFGMGKRMTVPGYGQQRKAYYVPAGYKG